MLFYFWYWYCHIHLKFQIWRIERIKRRFDEACNALRETVKRRPENQTLQNLLAKTVLVSTLLENRLKELKDLREMRDFISVFDSATNELSAQVALIRLSEWEHELDKR